MDQEKRHSLVCQLLSDGIYVEVGGITYYVENPTPEILQLGNQLYRKILHKNRFTKWIVDKQLLFFLIKSKQWTMEKEANLAKIPETLDSLKLDLYKAYGKPNVMSEIRKRIAAVRKHYETMSLLRHSYDHYTLAGYAEHVRQNFVFGECLYCDGSKFGAAFLLHQSIFYQWVKSRMSPEQCREISRTEPWRSYWSVDKQLLSSKNLTQEQRSVVSYSRMYDSIYEHTECPPDDILKDDDLLDGWQLFYAEKVKQEKDQDKKQMDNTLGNQYTKHAEIYLPAATQEEAEKIDALNDDRAKQIKKQRLNIVKQAGKVKEGDLPDVRQSRQMNATQQTREAMTRSK